MTASNSIEIIKPPPPFPAYIGLDIKIEIEGKIYNTSLRGMKEGEYLIIDTPAKQGSYISLHKDMGCVIRYIHEGEVFGFVTYVMKNFIEPIRTVLLEYPKKIESKNLRHSKRIETFIPVKIISDAEKEGKGYIVDMSISGCRIHVNGNIDYQPNHDINLSFNLPTSEEIKNMAGRVKNVMSNNGHINICSLGVEFNKPEEVSVKKIMDFLQLYLEIRGNSD